MANAKFIDATTWGNLTEIDVTDGENLFPQLPAGTYRPVLSGVASVTVPALSAGTIDQATPTEGDTLTVSGSNATGSATYQWQKGGVDISGATSASLDTTGEGTGDYRRGVSDGVQGPVYTSAVTVGAAATAPAQMSAPTVTATGANSISVDLAAAPADGGSAITSYDLRHSTNESDWIVVTGVTDPQMVSGLTASTLYYVQTRAVSAVGAGAWSTSDTATTDAAVSAFTDDFSGFTTGDDIGVDTANYAAGASNYGSKFAVTASDTAGMETTANGERYFEYIGSSPSVQNTDHYAEVEVTDIGANSDSSHNLYVLVRAVDQDNWVGMRFYQNRMVGIYRRDAGSAITNPSASLETPATDINPITTGDVFRIEAVGDTVTVYRNSSSICSWTHSDLDTGGAFETGAPGLAAFALASTYNTPFRINYFECGDV